MPKMNETTGNYDRTTGGKFDLVQELHDSPLGTKAGELRPGVVLNASPAQAVYFARNNSQMPRKVVKKGKHGQDLAASPTGHIAEEILEENKMDAAEIREASNMGRMDFTMFEMATRPVDKVLVFDGQQYILRCSREPGKPGEWVPVPEGVYELYCGSYKLLHSADEFERRDERNLVNSRWGPNPIAWVEGTDRPESSYIEFRREEITVAPKAADAQKIYAGVKVEI